MCGHYLASTFLPIPERKVNLDVVLDRPASPTFHANGAPLCTQVAGTTRAQGLAA